jgi:hypothetical protein
MAGMGVGKEWADARAEAQKVLGKDGKLPKPRTDPERLYDDVNAKGQTFNKAIEAVERALLERETAFAKIILAWKQYADIIKGSDFELDPKGGAKQIAQAQKILLEAITDITEKVSDKIAILDKLDQIVTNLNSLSLKAQ